MYYINHINTTIFHYIDLKANNQMFYPVLFLYPREVFPTMHRGGVPVQEQPMCERVSPL